MTGLPGSGQPLTLVATDVEGSTDLWEWDRAAMMEAISIHDSLLRAQLPDFHGYEVATEVRCMCSFAHTSPVTLSLVYTHARLNHVG